MNFAQLATDAAAVEVAQLRAELDRVSADATAFVARALPFTPPPAAVAKLQDRLSFAGDEFARACLKVAQPPQDQRRAVAAAVTVAVLLPAARVAMAELERQQLERLAAEPSGPMALTEMPRGEDP